MSKQEGGFIQFPLCILAAPLPFKEIMNWALAHATTVLMESYPEYGDIDFECFGDIEEMTLEDLHSRAMKAIGYSGGGYRCTQSTVGQIREFIASMDRHYGNSNEAPFVRIPTGYFFDMYNGAWRENEARIYIAIASAIGRKPYTRLGWNMIARRAAGYVKSPTAKVTLHAPKTMQGCGSGRLRVTESFLDTMGAQRDHSMFTEVPMRAYDWADGQPPMLTRDKIEYRLRALLAPSRGLLACYTYNGGVRYWGFPNKCDREQIARYVIQKRLRSHQEKTETDAALTRRITEELSHKGS